MYQSVQTLTFLPSKDIKVASGLVCGEILKSHEKSSHSELESFPEQMFGIHRWVTRTWQVLWLILNLHERWFRDKLLGGECWVWLSAGISTLGMCASPEYFDTYRRARLPATSNNSYTRLGTTRLVHAQRDLFGVHSYEWTKLARKSS
ncbi:hypothetical protein Bca4012_061120 [Brassica carinata]